MKKILLGIILLTVVVAFGYVKFVRDGRRTNEAFLEGKSEADRELQGSRIEAESLRYHIGEQQVEFADSIVALSLRHQAEVDSLVRTIDSLQENRPAVPASGSKTEAGKLTHEQAALHKKVLTYYRKRFDDLPSDLTSYEKKVAINEIRQETAVEFNITVAELNEIRDRNDVPY